MHPVLYVSARFGRVPVARQRPNLDPLPQHTLDGSTVNGGFLPHTSISGLVTSLGNINSRPACPIAAGPYNPTNPTPPGTAGDPDLLLASTYGSGSFGIRLAPLTLNASVDPASTNGLAPDGTCW